MIDIDFELVPVTKDLLDSLSPGDRYDVLNKYHAWLKLVRKKDRKQANYECKRIHNFNNRIRQSVLHMFRHSMPYPYCNHNIFLYTLCELRGFGE